MATIEIQNEIEFVVDPKRKNKICELIYPCQHDDAYARTGYCGIPVLPGRKHQTFAVDEEAGTATEQVWTWDHNTDYPTVNESIRCTVEGCGFHGFIRNGRIRKIDHEPEGGA